LVEHQIDDVKKLAADSRSKRDPNDFVDPGYAKIILATEEGKLTELKEQIRKKLAIAEKTNEDLATRIAESALLPHQAELLEQIAKFNRHMYESKYGDEFGAVTGWVELQESWSPAEKNELRELVKKKRDEYYRQLEKMRKSYCDEVDEFLKPEVLQKRESIFGKPYDIDQEVVNRWASARKKTSEKK
ncbi:hypothetical protein N9Z38_01640, partial [Mariniblastus sp.]|nr:hypothetical protein [Mariniblastus sp.]